jgi:hypothetical protein
MNNIKSKTAKGLYDEIHTAVMLPSLSKHCTMICLKHIIFVHEKYGINDPEELKQLKEALKEISKPFTT